MIMKAKQVRKILVCASMLSAISNYEMAQASDTFWNEEDRILVVNGVLIPYDDGDEPDIRRFIQMQSSIEKDKKELDELSRKVDIIFAHSEEFRAQAHAQENFFLNCYQEFLSFFNK